MNKGCANCGMPSPEEKPWCNHWRWLKVKMVEGCAVREEPCWFPSGCLHVVDEKPSWVPWPIIDRTPIAAKVAVIDEEDKKIFRAIAMSMCPEGCLFIWDEV